MKSFVYFVQAASGAIKIGISRHPAVRISSLQTASAEVITVLAIIPGDRAKEAAFHRKYSWARLRNEWFRPMPELLMEIEELKPLHVGPEGRTCDPDLFSRAAQFWVTRMEDDEAQLRGLRVEDVRPGLAGEAGLTVSVLENLRRGRISALTAADYEAIRILFIRKSDGVAAALRADISKALQLVGSFDGRARARAAALVSILDGVSAEGAGEAAR